MNNTNSKTLSDRPQMNLSSDLDGSQIAQLEEGQVSAQMILQASAYYVMIVLSLIGNTVVIKAVKRIGWKLRRQVYYLFMVNLSVADLLFAIENIPIICTNLLLNGIWQVEGPFGNFLCRFDWFVSLILILTSNLTILAIAVEKFCGIVFPLRRYVSKKRAYMIIASTWLASGIYASPLFSPSFAYLQSRNGNFRCHLCTECERVIHWFIFQTVLLAIGFVTTLVLYSAIGIKIWLGKTPGVQLHECQLRAQAKKYKALKMLAMLVVVFYISFIPFWIYQLLLYLGFKLGPHYGQVFAFLMYCNGALNPVIYSLYNSDIRAEFKALFTCKKPLERPRSFVTWQTRRRNEDLELSALYPQSPELSMRNIKARSCWIGASGREVNGETNAAYIYEDTRL